MIETKEGVLVYGLKAEALLALIVTDQVMEKHGIKRCVLTSAADGEHSENSYHYGGDAIDIRDWYFDSDEQKEVVVAEIRARLTKEYDVVVESTHIHIEFDRRRAADLSGDW